MTETGSDTLEMHIRALAEMLTKRRNIPDVEVHLAAKEYGSAIDALNSVINDHNPSEFNKDIAKRYGPGSLGRHEAMHMANVLTEMVDEQLCQHIAISINPEWHEMAETARQTLHDLYQAIANEH